MIPQMTTTSAAYLSQMGLCKKTSGLALPAVVRISSGEQWSQARLTGSKGWGHQDWFGLLPMQDSSIEFCSHGLENRLDFTA